MDEAHGVSLRVSASGFVRVLVFLPVSVCTSVSECLTG
jgi:hypothetical protein